MTQQEQRDPSQSPVRERALSDLSAAGFKARPAEHRTAGRQRLGTALVSGSVPQDGGATVFWVFAVVALTMTAAAFWFNTPGL